MTEEITYSCSGPKPRSILPPDMISVEEARERILAHFAPLEPESTPLLDALGQVLAEDVHSGFDIPPADNTAMDGYAVRSQDTSGATPETPRVLRVTGYLPAGSVFDGEVGAGEAVRIMTGAPMPRGADAIVPFEETDEQDEGHAAVPWHEAPREHVRIDVEARPGANIRRAGEDVREGERALPSGTVLGPAQIGVLASQDHRVHRGRGAVDLDQRLPFSDLVAFADEPLGQGPIFHVHAPLGEQHVCGHNESSVRAELGLLQVAGPTPGRRRPRR